MIRAWLNPIINIEMKTRMRGARATIILTIYLIVLSCTFGTAYINIYQQSNTYTLDQYQVDLPNVQDGPTIGKAIFLGTTFLLMTLISHLAPAFTATAIAGERERQTFEVLITTPLKARQIVSGKLGSVLLFLLLLILASLPIQSIAFLFGGVSFQELMIATLVLVITAIAYGMWGLYISSMNHKSVVAIIATYALLIPFIYGLPMMLMYLSAFPLSMGILFATQSELEWLGTLLAVATMYFAGFLMSINPYASGFLTVIAASNGYGYFFFTEQGPNGGQLPFVSPWLIYCVFYLLLTLFLFRRTIRRLEQVSKF